MVYYPTFTLALPYRVNTLLALYPALTLLFLYPLFFTCSLPGFTFRILYCLFTILWCEQDHTRASGQGALVQLAGLDYACPRMYRGPINSTSGPATGLQCPSALVSRACGQVL